MGSSDRLNSQRSMQGHLGKEEGTVKLPAAEEEKASWHSRLGCLGLTGTVRVVPLEGKTAGCLPSTPDPQASLSWVRCSCSALLLLVLQPQQEI